MCYLCLDSLSSPLSRVSLVLMRCLLCAVSDGRGNVETQTRRNGVNVTYILIMSVYGCICAVPCNKLHFLSSSEPCFSTLWGISSSWAWVSLCGNWSAGRAEQGRDLVLSRSWSFARTYTSTWEPGSIPGSYSIAWLINHGLINLLTSNTFLVHTCIMVRLLKMRSRHMRGICQLFGFQNWRQNSVYEACRNAVCVVQLGFVADGIFEIGNNKINN